MKIPKNVQNLLFDLGGVIIDLDISRSLDAFKRAGARNVDNWFRVAGQAEMLNLYEKGLIAEEDFIREASSFTQPALDKDTFIEGWNAMLGDIPAERIRLLNLLRQKYRVLALSNINSLHEKACDRILMNAHQVPHLRDLFDHAYYSHEINERKPDVSCFEKVIALSGIDPAATLFFDDNVSNLETARQLGFLTCLVDRDICSILAEAGRD